MNKRILNLAIPNIISNITVPLVGLVDVALMGHQQSVIYLGAIALGSMIFTFIYSAFGFLRMGTSGFTAQARGRRDFSLCIHTLGRAAIVAMAGTLLLWLLQIPIAHFTFWIIGASGQVEILARQYFYIRIWAAPATLGVYALSGWFLGMQNAKTPMVMALVINLANIIVSYSLIRFGGLKSDGVAWGTVIAQYCGLITGIVLFNRHYLKLVKYWSHKAMMDVNALKDFFHVNRDIFLRTILLTGTIFFFTSKSAVYGNTLLAVNTLLLQFLWIYSYFIDGFAFAAEALTGRYMGSGDKQKLSVVINRLFTWGLIISSLATIVYYTAGEYILQILTTNPTVLLAVKPYFLWAVAIPLTTFPAFLWDGIYIGATASVPMRNAMIASVFFVFLPAYYLLEPLMGNHGLWLAMTLFMISRGLFLSFRAKKAPFFTIPDKTSTPSS